MHYLKKEFNRLIKYAEGLGIKVTLVSKNNPDASAEWRNDGSEIILYDQAKDKPLKNCLLLYHELAHHIAWVHNGRKDTLKTDQILGKVAMDLELTELQRKHLYEIEKDDSEYQAIIHKEIGSKIPVERLKIEIEFDLWQYKYYWKNNDWPTFKQQAEYRKSLNGKN